ncbi:hypothetical protein V1264_003913 [Littorina saxatilis]|uniref:Receptor ligand binding region domain-containing protein n=2 Tax=Littorina saxatilis TaxID=31220 RepID=A0AAN9B163_9CAEN
MLDIVQRVGANYIQVIYDSSTAYAKALFDKLQDQVATPNSKYSKVCIAQSIPTIPRSDASQYKYIVDKLRDKSAAKVVIVILHAVEIEKVMDAILPLLKPEDDFLFLASESWGRRQGIIEGRTKLEGSLVLAQEIAVDQNFARYFADLDPTNSSVMNPWLKFFWETRLNCYFDKSFERRGKDPNNPKVPCPIHFADDYAQDSRVPFHIQAVKALVKGFHDALTETCGPTTRSTCPALSSAKLVTAMHKVKLDLYSTGQHVQVFDSNGDGLVGFKVLKISRDLAAAEDRVIYTEIGQWTDEVLKIDPDDVKAVTSVCPNAAECDRCFKAAQNSGQDSGQAAQGGVPVFVTAGMGAVLGVIVVILAVVIICLVRRHNVLTKNKRLNQIMRRPVAALEDRYSHEYDSPNCQNSDREELPPPLPPACHKRPSPTYLTPAMADMVESPTL